jgi:hypothetical protein
LSQFSYNISYYMNNIGHTPWAMGMWATLRTKKRATGKIPGCQDGSRQFNKGFIGNAQYGRVEAHF